MKKICDKTFLNHFYLLNYRFLSSRVSMTMHADWENNF